MCVGRCPDPLDLFIIDRQRLDPGKLTGHILNTMDVFMEDLGRQLCEAGSIMPWATEDRNGLEDRPSLPSDPHALFCPELSYDWTDEEHIEAPSAGSPAHLMNISALSGTRSPAVRDPLSYILPEDEPSRSRGASSKNQGTVSLPGTPSPAKPNHQHLKLPSTLLLDGEESRPLERDDVSGIPDDLFGGHTRAHPKGDVKRSKKEDLLLTEQNLLRHKGELYTFLVDQAIERELEFFRASSEHNRTGSANASSVDAGKGHMTASQLLDAIHKQEADAFVPDSPAFLDFLARTDTTLRSAKESMHITSEAEVTTGSDVRRIITELRVRGQDGGQTGAGEERERLLQTAKVLDKRHMRRINVKEDVTVKSHNGTYTHGPDRIPIKQATSRLLVEARDKYISRIGKVPFFELYK